LGTGRVSDLVKGMPADWLLSGESRVSELPSALLAGGETTSADAYKNGAARQIAISPAVSLRDVFTV